VTWLSASLRIGDQILGLSGKADFKEFTFEFGKDIRSFHQFERQTIVAFLIFCAAVVLGI